MPTSMGVINPKIVKGGRNLKKAKHCNIPKKKKKNFEQNEKKITSEMKIEP